MQTGLLVDAASVWDHAHWVFGRRHALQRQASMAHSILFFINCFRREEGGSEEKTLPMGLAHLCGERVEVHPSVVQCKRFIIQNTRHICKFMSLLHMRVRTRLDTLRVVCAIHP